MPTNHSLALLTKLIAPLASPHGRRMRLSTPLLHGRWVIASIRVSLMDLNKYTLDDIFTTLNVRSRSLLTRSSSRSAWGWMLPCNGADVDLRWIVYVLLLV